MYRFRVLSALAVVALVVLAPEVTHAAPCGVRIATTAAERAALWNDGLTRFAERPGLNAAQMKFLGEAAALGKDIATLKTDDPGQAAFARKAARIMEQARDLFTNDELGALFTSMGSTQVWLSRMVAVPAYCNCMGTGTCQMAGGGPSGNCITGCVSWTGDDGSDRIRICTPGAEAAN